MPQSSGISGRVLPEEVLEDLQHVLVEPQRRLAGNEVSLGEPLLAGCILVLDGPRRVHHVRGEGAAEQREPRVVGRDLVRRVGHAHALERGPREHG